MYQEERTEKDFRLASRRTGLIEPGVNEEASDFQEILHAEIL